jgi:hypothetical protein
MIRTRSCCIFLFTSSFAPASGPIVPAAPVELFNGRDLTGWYPALQGHAVGENTDGIVKVSDGLLHIAGDARGCLTTDASYANYRLIGEFKWGTGGLVALRLKQE